MTPGFSGPGAHSIEQMTSGEPLITLGHEFLS
jgi:hypothetical protein